MKKVLTNFSVEKASKNVDDAAVNDVDKKGKEKKKKFSLMSMLPFKCRRYKRLFLVVCDATLSVLGKQFQSSIKLMLMATEFLLKGKDQYS
jgi:hypothetical protein